MSNYSYSRIAAKKKPKADEPEKTKKPSRTDGAKPGEVEAAIKAIEKALDAVHDCAPNGKDYRDDGGYDSKAYQKEVEAHSDRIHALNDILDELSELRESAELRGKTASYDRTTMEHATPEARKKYLQEHPDADPKNHEVKDHRRTTWEEKQQGRNFGYEPDEFKPLRKQRSLWAAHTTMRAGMWYEQKSVGLWFLAQKEQKNGGFAGKMVRWTTRNPKAINDSVPKSFWSLWKELPESEVPSEVKDAVK